MDSHEQHRTKTVGLEFVSKESSRENMRQGDARLFVLGANLGLSNGGVRTLSGGPRVLLPNMLEMLYAFDAF